MYEAAWRACRSPIRSWTELWDLPMRQKMPPKMMALDTLLMARPMLVALSRLTWRLHRALLTALTICQSHRLDSPLDCPSSYSHALQMTMARASSSMNEKQ